MEWPHTLTPLLIPYPEGAPISDQLLLHCRPRCPGDIDTISGLRCEPWPGIVMGSLNQPYYGRFYLIKTALSCRGSSEIPLLSLAISSLTIISRPGKRQLNSGTPVNYGHNLQPEFLQENHRILRFLPTERFHVSHKVRCNTNTYFWDSMIFYLLSFLRCLKYIGPLLRIVFP